MFVCRPHSTDSATHRKMTLSLADRCSKTQKIRILPMAGRDPESQRNEMIKVKQTHTNFNSAKRFDFRPRLMKKIHIHTEMLFSEGGYFTTCILLNKKLIFLKPWSFRRKRVHRNVLLGSLSIMF